LSVGRSRGDEHRRDRVHGRRAERLAVGVQAGVC
jgi:hypothetical protein